MIIGVDRNSPEQRAAWAASQTLSTLDEAYGKARDLLAEVKSTAGGMLPHQPDPATFSELLRIAADAGVTEFEAGPFKVKFSNHVAEHWRLRNRIAVDAKGRPV
jgi:hypothetical protein